MIAIVDYGLGNIRAFVNVYERLNIPMLVARSAKDLEAATKIILPGVGAFDDAMTRLHASGMKERLDELVLHEKVPVLGICIGMQILARSSEEGSLPGLGWIDGVVKKMDVSGLTNHTRLPHMGWNTAEPIKDNRLFNGLKKDSRFYFLHSYCFHCNKDGDIVAVSDYGGVFTCAINSGNIFGVQFHPEKSHQNGIQLLKNFEEL